MDPVKAQQIATRIWIERNGLQYTSKANFVDVLGETIRNTNSYMTTNYTNEKLKEEKAERLLEADRVTAHSIIGITQDNAYERFQEAADRYYVDNNGVLTKGAANTRAARMMFDAAAEKDEETLSLLGRVLVVSGNEGTALSKSYPILFREARQKVIQNTQRKKIEKRNAIMTQLGIDLQGLSGSERGTRIQQAIQELGGDLDGVRQLRGMYEDLTETPEQFQNFTQLMSQINSGIGISDRELTRKVASGELSRNSADKLRTASSSLLKQSEAPAKQAASFSTDKFKQTLAINIGARISPTDPYKNIFGPDAFVDPKRANAIAKSFQVDLNERLSEVRSTINYAEATPAEIEQTLAKAAEEFYQKEALDPSGRYYLGGVFTLKGKPKEDSDEARLIRNAVNEFGIVDNNPPTNVDQDASNRWSPSDGYPGLYSWYKPGKILFDKQETASLVARAQKTGIPADIVKLAEAVGMTALEFVNSQADYHGNARLAGLSQANAEELTGKAGDRRNSNPDQQGYESAASRAIPAFIARGFSSKGAAFAAAYIRVRAKDLNQDIFRETDYVGDFVGLLSPQELALFQNPKLTMREINAAMRNMINGPSPDYTPFAARFLKNIGY
jgi:hypothetical protein